MLETPMITKTNWTIAFLIPVPFWIIVNVLNSDKTVSSGVDNHNYNTRGYR